MSHYVITAIQAVAIYAILEWTIGEFFHARTRMQAYNRLASSHNEMVKERNRVIGEEHFQYAEVYEENLKTVFKHFYHKPVKHAQLELA